jgi:hypothetical protein
MDQIDTVLDLIQQRLNAFLQNIEARPDGWVVLSNVRDYEGRPVEAVKDKLALVLANITFESSARNTPPARAPGGSGMVRPPQRVDLTILLFANFSGDTYRSGLQVIGRAMTYFHQNLIFMTDNAPGITITPANLGLAELNELTAMLGAKYLPCVAYTVRAIPLSD